MPIGNKPKFLGAIQQRYRPRNEKPATSFQIWIDKIRGAIEKTLVPSLAQIDCVVDRAILLDALVGSELQPYDLAHVPDFNSLIAISQQLSTPIFALTDAQIKSVGKVFGHAEATMLESRNNFDTVFTSLASRIVALTR